MEKFEEAFVFTRTAQELKADTLSTYRPHHRRDFDRHALLAEKHLEIEDIIHLYDRLAFDDASAHRDISYHAGPPNAAAGEGQGQPNRNALMLATVQETFRIITPNVKGEESVTARLAAERRDKQQHGDVFGIIKAMGPQDAVFPAVRTVKYSGHRALASEDC